MTSPEDRELEGLRAEWQSIGALRLDDLAVRVARDRRKLFLSAGLEVGAVIFSSVLVGWLLVRTKGAPTVVSILVVILLFNGAWITHFFAMRKGLYEPAASDATAFVNLTEKRLQTELQWLVYARRWLAILCALVVPWSVWVFVTHREAYLAAPWRAVVGFGGAAVISAGTFAWIHHKRRRLERERERFRTLVGSVSE